MCVAVHCGHCRACGNGGWLSVVGASLCPFLATAGEACGLVKNLALTAHITAGGDEQPVLRMLLGLGVVDATLLSAEEVGETMAVGAFFSSTHPTAIQRHLDRRYGVLLGDA